MWHKLPIHIIHHIFSYSYHVQSKQLLRDIVHFHNTKQLLFENQPLTFIICDLHHFINWFQVDYISSSYYATFFRHYMLHDNVSVLRFIEKSYTLPLHSQINILWGLMKPWERNEFLSII
jgi:hypothetical protein